VLEGIACVLSTGIGWTKLPAERGYGSGWTCWRRMRQWAEAGVFDRLQQAVLDRLREQDRLDWSRASLDSVSVLARGVYRPGRTRPTETSAETSTTCSSSPTAYR
jgi:transposase